jgi:hypothetical protein
MDSIIDLTQSRKARHERGENFRNAAKDLLTLIETQRQFMTEEFMTFLIAMAVSDQALHYATVADNKKAGLNFIDHLFTTVRQIFETNYPGHPEVRARSMGRGNDASSARVVEMPRIAQDGHLD